MSKLDGNGRWQTKMMLTEHAEQYDKRNDLSLLTDQPQKNSPWSETI